VLESTRLVGRPVFFSMAIILLAFVPVFALSGQEGKLFHPLAFTKTFAVLAATVIAVTLVPVLCTLLLGGKFHGEDANPVMRLLRRLYRPVLETALAHRALTLLVAAVLFVGALGVARGIGSEFMPPLNEGDLMFMPIADPSISLEENTKLAARQNAVLKGALNSLRDESSPIHNKRGGDPVNTLAVVYLRYRGSPAGEHEGRVDSNETLRVLCEADYVYGKKDDDLVPAMLDKTVDSARRSLIEHLGQPVERGEIQFDTGWEELVLPAVDAYSHGSLLPPLRGTLDAPAVN